jgi:hypothetical protein
MRAESAKFLLLARRDHADAGTTTLRIAAWASQRRSTTRRFWDLARVGDARVPPTKGHRTGRGLRLGSIPLMPDEDFEGGSEPASGKAPINRNALRCSFCGKVYAEVKTMVCGPTPLVAICNECVQLVTEIMREERGGPTQAA